MLDTWIASRTPSRESCKYIFSFILDDRIICSWCLNVLNIRFNVFRYIRCFDQNFRRLIDFRTHYSHNLWMVWSLLEHTLQCSLRSFKIASPSRLTRRRIGARNCRGREEKERAFTKHSMGTWRDRHPHSIYTYTYLINSAFKTFYLLMMHVIMLWVRFIILCQLSQILNMMYFMTNFAQILKFEFSNLKIFLILALFYFILLRHPWKY